MALETRSPTILRFGTFEVDLRAGELRKQGAKIKVQEQPFQVLAALLQQPEEVVTREELRQQIWPKDTFVDFDNSLNIAINKLREALGDSADNPRFIETLPRRGYRFIAPVTSNDRKELAAPGPAVAVRTQRWKIGLGVAVVVLVAAAGGFLWRSRQPRMLSDKDTIVLGDFANSTGDPVFDGTLREGLSVQLEQSPFLSLLSDEGIHQTLRMMGQSASARLTPEIAREVCQRTNSTAALGGSIALIGTRYDLIEQPSAVSDSSKICQLHPKPRVRNRSTTPNARRVRVRHIKRQTDCLDGELRKARQDLASIGLLVQPARELRRIPAPYRSELLGLSS